LSGQIEEAFFANEVEKSRPLHSTSTMSRLVLGSLSVALSFGNDVTTFEI